MDNTHNILIIIIIILIFLYITKTNTHIVKKAEPTAPVPVAVSVTDLEKDKEINALKQQVLENKIRTEVIQDNQDATQLRYNRVYDPLTSPERSYPFMMNRNKVPINIETRGRSMEYQQIGYIYSDDEGENKLIYPLYGKQLWRGSSKWSYYTGTDKMHQIKLPIIYNNRQCMGEHGCDELYNNDIIKIPPYNKDFKVEIYNLDAPKYIPV